MDKRAFFQQVLAPKKRTNPARPENAVLVSQPCLFRCCSRTPQRVPVPTGTFWDREFPKAPDRFLSGNLTTRYLNITRTILIMSKNIHRVLLPSTLQLPSTSLKVPPRQDHGDSNPGQLEGRGPEALCFLKDLPN